MSDDDEQNEIQNEQIFVLLKNDVTNNNSKVLYCSDEYSDALIKFQSEYTEYLNDDDYIVREYNQKNNFYIYKRIKGFLWDSKELLYTFKLLGWSEKE